jgi:adenine deaminase
MLGMASKTCLKRKEEDGLQLMIRESTVNVNIRNIFKTDLTQVLVTTFRSCTDIARKFKSGTSTKAIYH